MDRSEHEAERSRTRRPRQPELGFPEWGGARRGAGRPPKGAESLAPHDRRETFPPRFPIHVTARVRPELPPLRRPGERAVLLRAFAAGADRFGFRLVHFSIQDTHLHLIVEVDRSDALARGVKGLLGRSAKALNRHWSRSGRVFDDRFHAHVLRTPREVRRALIYVLNNARKHGWSFRGPDPYSSAAPSSRRRIAVDPKHWLLSVGWRRASPT